MATSWTEPDDDHRVELLGFNKYPDPKLRFTRVRGLFPPMPGTEFDSIIMKIFSYLNIKKTAL